MKHTVPTELHEMVRIILSENTMNLEDSAAQLQLLRSESKDMDQFVMRALLEQLAFHRRGLAEARSQIKKCQTLVEKITNPPWHPALFHRTIAGPSGLKAIVQTANTRRVVSAGEEVDLSALKRGDEVYLNNEQNLIVAISPEGAPRGGETGTFECRMPDGRLVVRSREEPVVVDAAGQIENVQFKAGDAVRFDRTFWMAFEKIELSPGKRYLIDEVPTISRDQVGGQHDNLESVLSVLTMTLVSPERAAAYGLNGRNSILMCGPPGCGKTLIARVAASEVARLSGKKCRFAVVKPAEWESPYVGQTQENIRIFFRCLKEAAEDGAAVAFLDELESVGRIRGGAVSHHSDKFLAALLAELDGFADRKNVAIICATNRKDLLDAALYERCSDVEILVSRPDMKGARAIFQIHLPESVPYHPNGELAKSTREELIELAVSKIYSPNAGNELCTIRFRDNKQRTVVARELASGRVFENVCRTARRNAFRREMHGGPAGVRLADMEDAVNQTLDRMRTTLTIHNARAYLADLPQDVDVVSVEPIVRKVKQPHHYFNRDAI